MTKFEQLRGLCYLAADLLLIRTLIPFCAQLIRPDISLAAQNFFYFLFGFAAVLWLFRDFLKLNVRHFRLFPKQILLTALVGICSYLALTELVGTLTVLLYPQFLNFNDSAIIDLLEQNFPLMAVGTVLLVPVTEELLYRGLVFGNLLNKSKPLAYILSAALFAAIHVLPHVGQQTPEMLLCCALQYLPAGISLGWAYHKSGSIFAPILIHAAVNAMGIAAMR